MLKKYIVGRFLFLAMIAFMAVHSETKAQTLIPDEVSLERAVYANLQKGIGEFHGITEKHQFVIKDSEQVNEAIEELKKDKRVITAAFSAKLHTLTVVIQKTELNEAKLWLQPLIEAKKITVISHGLQYYLKTN